MKRLWKFDYIKAMAVISVILIHATEVEKVRSNVIFPFYIWLAVPTFMLISGYMNAKSCEKHGITRLVAWYEPKYLGKKILFIMIPYLIIYVCEWASQIVFFHRIVGIRECIYVLFTGGWGPGSYYVLMLVQLMLVFPLIYFLVVKMPRRGSVIIIGLQLLLECAVQYAEISESLYRILFLRYIIFIWFGIMLYCYYEKLNRIYIALMGIAGGLYLWGITYSDWKLPIFRNWESTSMPTVLWIGFLLILAMRYLIRLPQPIDKVVIKVGTSTYYIFLVQMMYFAFNWQISMSQQWIENVIVIIICCTLGIAFRFFCEKGIYPVLGMGE